MLQKCENKTGEICFSRREFSPKWVCCWISETVSFIYLYLRQKMCRSTWPLHFFPLRSVSIPLTRPLLIIYLHCRRRFVMMSPLFPSKGRCWGFEPPAGLHWHPSSPHSFGPRGGNCHFEVVGWSNAWPKGSPTSPGFGQKVCDPPPPPHTLHIACRQHDLTLHYCHKQIATITTLNNQHRH